jgi:transposase
MVTFGSTLRYFIYEGGVDMRKSFDGLQGLIVNRQGRTGLDGEVYVFFNRRRTQVKLLVWDRSGFVIYYKRLERGTFGQPLGAAGGPAARSVSWSDLQMILEGIELQSVQRRLRYERA